MLQRDNITMNVEIMINFQELNISTYELCRILGILLDNAIEATKQCEEKIINIKFIKDFKVNRKLIIIENSFNQSEIIEKRYLLLKVDLNSLDMNIISIKSKFSDLFNNYMTYDEFLYKFINVPFMSLKLYF